MKASILLSLLAAVLLIGCAAQAPPVAEENATATPETPALEEPAEEREEETEEAEAPERPTTFVLQVGVPLDITFEDGRTFRIQASRSGDFEKNASDPAVVTFISEKLGSDTYVRKEGGKVYSFEKRRVWTDDLKTVNLEIGLLPVADA